MTVTDDLPSVVEKAISFPVRSLVEVRREPLAYDAFLAGRSITRITGVALVDAERIPWSVFEKVTDRPGVESAAVARTLDQESGA